MGTLIRFFSSIFSCVKPYGADFKGHTPSVLSQAAQHLALIHQLDGAGFSWLPQRLEPEQARGGQEYVDRLWQVVQAYRPLTQPNKLCVLHGDFWPGNLLWRDQQLVAIIDWEDSWLGDPLADLARSRLEILWAWGEAAMDNFTDYYQQAMPNIEYAALPYWECYAALELAAFATWTHDFPTLFNCGVANQKAVQSRQQACTLATAQRRAHDDLQKESLVALFSGQGIMAR